MSLMSWARSDLHMVRFNRILIVLNIVMIAWNVFWAAWVHTVSGIVFHAIYTAWHVWWLLKARDSLTFWRAQIDMTHHRKANS